MARLPNQDTQKGETRTGPNAAILDKILGLSDRKRARPLPAGAAGSSSSGSSSAGSSSASAGLSSGTTSSSSSGSSGSTSGSTSGSPGNPSSLEYTSETKNRGQQVSPNQMRRKKADQQEHQQQQQQQQNARPVTTTRARGSSGIPPRTLDMSDLEGMDPEQILQALYDNPELVAAASERFEKENEKKAAGMKQMNKSKKTKKGSKYSYTRTEDGRVLKEGDRLDLLKKEGFPYFQWIIISVILGAGIYQLYKCVTRPTTTKAMHTKAKAKASRATKKVKTVKGKKDKPASRSLDVDTIVATIEGDKTPSNSNSNHRTASTKPTKPNVPKKKAPEKKPEAADKVVEEEKTPLIEKPAPPETTVPKKKARKPKVKAAATTKQDGAESPDSNGSSCSATAVVDKKAPKAPSAPVALEAPPTDEGEWQTVGAKTVPTITVAAPEPEKVKQPPAKPASKNGSSKKQLVPVSAVKEEAVPALKEEAKAAPVSKESLTTTNGGAEQPPAAEPVAEKNQENGMTTVQKKKKKANKMPKANGLSNGGGDIETKTSTDSDAALALQLQTEEEHMALVEKGQAADAAASSDVWAEVTTKKKKPTKA